MSLPTEARTLELASLFAELSGRLATELGAPQLVLPNAAYFPDRFTKDAASVQRLLNRLQRHAALGDIPVEVVVYDEEGGSIETGCGGACAPRVVSDTPGRITLENEEWHIHLLRPELAHATALTTLLSMCLGRVFLEEVRDDSKRAFPPKAQPAELAQLAELTAVRLGLGVLLLEGSHIYSKGCGGPNIAKLTALDTGELALLVALHAKAHSLKLKDAYSLLSATQASTLKQAEELIAANPPLVEWVKRGRSGEDFSLSAPRPRLLAWLLPKSKPEPDLLGDPLLMGIPDAALLLAQKTQRTEQRAPQVPARAADEELRRLVEEALEQS